jgi:hypothetical protein
MPKDTQPRIIRKKNPEEPQVQQFNCYDGRPLNPVDSALDTLELTWGKWMGEVRKQCRATSQLLYSRVRSTEGVDPLWKAAKKIECCTMFGAYLHHSQEVNHKIGTALCKNRLCPNCQTVLSRKRNANFLAFFQLNKSLLRKYYFYHLVLTVRHDARKGLRTGLYTSELLNMFQQLRGKDNNRAWRSWWDARVAGGTFSTEIKAGKDSSPHIHIHCLIVAHRQLYRFGKVRSVFEKAITEKWQQITKDNQNVPFLEPVYTWRLDDDGNKVYIDGEAQKDYAPWGHSAHVDAAVAECAKYTLKADANSLAGYTDEFLRELLRTRNRYYGRFGCLSGNSPASKQFENVAMLATDYKDLEAMEKLELEMLLNPETGEVAEKDSLPVVLTPFRNVKYKEPAPRLHRLVHQTEYELRGRFHPGGQVRELLDKPEQPPGYYSINAMRDCAIFPPWRRHEVGQALARTVTNIYEPDNDIL